MTTTKRSSRRPNPCRRSITRSRAAPSTCPFGASRSGCSMSLMSLSCGRVPRWPRQGGSPSKENGHRYGESPSNKRRVAAIAPKSLGREGRPKRRPSSVLTLTGDNSGRLAIQRAQLVAVGIAQISEIHLAGRALANARRILDRLAAIRDTGFVPRLGLFGTAHQKRNRPPIGMAGRLAVDRFGHHEASAVMRVGEPAPGIFRGGLGAHRAKQRVVKFLRPGDVVAPVHDVAEHSVFSSWELRGPAVSASYAEH